MGPMTLDTSVSQSQNTEQSSLEKCGNSQKRLTSHKLSDGQKQRVLNWLGMCRGIGEVQKLIKSEFGITMSRQAIYQHKFHPNNQAYLQKARDEWSRQLFMVDLVSKRKRLEELEDMYDRNKGKDDHIAMDALQSIRQEVEKDLSSLSMTNYNINVYKDMTETELEEERMKSLERIRILKGAITDATHKKGN